MTPALLMMIAVGAPALRPLFDPADPGEPSRWIAVHDTVMGGRSQGGLWAGDGCLVFAGEMSLENNGGFASVRTGPRALELAGAEGLEIRVRGDGRRYQLRLRQDDRFDGVAWAAEFATEPGRWLTVRVPLADFRPTWRGRAVAGAGPVDPARVRQFGVMIADKAAGPFRLELAQVAAY